MTYLAIRDFSVDYTMQRSNRPLPAAHSVTLTVRSREFVVAIVPSAHAKSSVLTVVADFVPPQADTVALDVQPFHRGRTERTQSS